MEINYDMDYVVRVKKEKLEIKPLPNKTNKKEIILINIGILLTIAFLTLFMIKGIEIEWNIDLVYIILFPILMIVISTISFIIKLMEPWSLKIENGYIYIKQLFKEYKIDLKNLINIEKKQHRYSSYSYRYSYSYSGRGSGFVQYIIITYIKDNKFKEKKLQYRVIRTSRTPIKVIEQHISDEDIFKLFEHFITKSQLEKNELLSNTDYIEIRNTSENIDLEEKIKTIMGRLDKSDTIYVSIMLFIFCAIIAVVILAPLLEKKL